MLSPGQEMHLGVASATPDLTVYRAAVWDLTQDIAGHTGQDVVTTPEAVTTAERVLLDRVEEPELAAVLSATPLGLTGATTSLLAEARRCAPDGTGSMTSLADRVRIFLASQVDAMWWGHTPPYATDADVTGSADLVDLDPLRRGGVLGFCYRRQAGGLPARVLRALDRRIRPNRTPHTPGLRFAQTRPEAVALLNQVARELARLAPEGTPPIWVTSLTRSVRHQHHLRSLGYAAMLPSSHCVGYAMDVETRWYRQFGADRLLTGLLLDRQDAGDANIIDEGQVWHMCISPAASTRLRAEFEGGLLIGGPARTTRPGTPPADSTRPSHRLLLRWRRPCAR